MHNGNPFPFAFKPEHLTTLTKHDLPVRFSPRDRRNMAGDHDHLYQSSWMALNAPVTLRLAEAAEQDGRSPSWNHLGPKDSC